MGCAVSEYDRLLCFTDLCWFLWFYPAFLSGNHYLNSKNQGGSLSKQALRFDEVLTG